MHGCEWEIADSTGAFPVGRVRRVAELVLEGLQYVVSSFQTACLVARIRMRCSVAGRWWQQESERGQSWPGLDICPGWPILCPVAPVLSLCSRVLHLFWSLCYLSLVSSRKALIDSGFGVCVGVVGFYSLKISGKWTFCDC